MITEKERKNRDELFKLMQEKPDLPVIPLVEGDVVGGDDFSSWMGSWGTSCVDEYLISNDDYMLFRSDDDVFGTLERYLSEEAFEALPESESDCRPIYLALPWIKAIFVHICSAEV